MTVAATIAQAFEHYGRGDLHRAEVLCREALSQDARAAEGWLLLGVLADHARAPQDAEKHLLHAATLAPHEPRIWNSLGTVRDGVGDYDGATFAYQQALKVRPDYAPAWHNLGEVHRSLGRHREAVEHYRRALRTDPSLAPAWSNLLFTLHFDPTLTDAQIWDEHRRWGEGLAARVPVMEPDRRPADPDRPLTVGYIGPDFREHAVARFFEPLLAAHDRRRFRYVLYSECPIVDAVGQRMREHGDLWRIVRGRSAEDVARQVRSDNVDILIDLAGHTRDNRLDVLARRPAPVQMTFLGYPFPTGLPRVDYRISDSVLDPTDAPVRTGLGESILRLPPGVCCFRPPDAAPPVNELPLSSKGFFTFGSFHPLTKLNPPMLAIWGSIARRLPTAKFLFVRNGWEGAAARELRARLAAAGIPDHQIELRKPSIAPGEYLRTFHDMDAALDAVPFNGHTMTCESLWMGVPVLTLRGDRPAGRLTSSVLTAMGLTDWIAENADTFIDKAATLANDPDRLVELRASLRQRLMSSIGNAALYSRSIEGLFREAWRTWCRSRTDAPMTSPAAEACWEDAHARACSTLETGDSDAAAALFRQASELNPLAVPPRAMLAGLLSDRCDLAGAAEQYSLALKIGPDAKLRIAAALALPPIYDSNDQIAECRGKLVEKIDALHADGVRLDPLRGPIPNLFLLAYQGENDRDIMRSYARLFAPSSWATQPVDAKPGDGRIRVGLISEYFCNHTIGTLNHGLVEKLDRKRFHVTVLSLTKSHDETNKLYRQHADAYVDLPSETAAAVRLIRGLGLDIALFTDLGMSCGSLALAHARLARRQAVTWGHPVTTGIATIDDFLSSAFYEIPSAHNHYTEKLILLNGINTHYSRPMLNRQYSKSEFKLPDQSIVYGCPQTLFKFHPDFDAVIRGILERDRNNHLVLIEGRNRYWKERLVARWARTMPTVMNQLHWLPTLPKQQYLGLLSVCDALLDPLHFGGGNSTLEALALGVPVVTLPPPYLRGRLTYGFYQSMNCHDLIVMDDQSYIEIAHRIATDRSWRSDVVKRITENSGYLYGDARSVRGYEDYFTALKQ